MKMRASRRRPLSHTAPRMSFEPNPVPPEPRPLTWNLRNPGPCSGWQTAVLFQALPGGLPPKKTQGQGRTRLLPLPSGSPDPSFGQALPLPACGGLRCELWRGRCGAHGRAPQPSPPLPSPRWGSKTTGHPTPADPSCGHLALCPALPRAHSKNLLAFFVPIFESPPAPQRGLEPLLLFLAPYLPALGGRGQRDSSHPPITEAGLSALGNSKCREGPGCLETWPSTRLWTAPQLPTELPWTH